MNKTVSETKKYLDVIKENYKDSTDRRIVVCLPFTSMSLIKKYTFKNLFFGAQNMHEEEKGAYTGEISAKMLKELGTKFVILGHSERRKYFNENNDKINKKIKTALRYGFEVVLCIGETRVQKNTGKTSAVLQKQIGEALSGIYENELKNIIIAYEPVWAVGTGLVAGNVDVNKAVKIIKETVSKLYSSNTDISVIYGGSLTSQNLAKMLKNKNVCGFLIGGASLEPYEFLKMIDKM